jgi:hypothetical protein
MMAGGKDGVKVASSARRPSIRPKAVTPPRAGASSHVTLAAHDTPTRRLPPVRTPEPRIAKRRVLVLVDQDDTIDEVASQLPALVMAPHESAWWKQPRSVALVVVSVLAAAFTTTAVVWTALARRDAAEASVAVSTTTISSASLTLEAPLVPTLAEPRRHDSAIPVVDVNSLPAAPSRMATSSAR